MIPKKTQSIHDTRILNQKEKNIMKHLSPDMPTNHLKPRRQPSIFDIQRSERTPIMREDIRALLMR